VSDIRLPGYSNPYQGDPQLPNISFALKKHIICVVRTETGKLKAEAFSTSEHQARKLINECECRLAAVVS
jgi:PhoPQ-activated pathogenicity-related protein